LRYRIASFSVASYLLLCIGLGGSSQSPWPPLVLQLLGIALIAWAAISRTSDAERDGARGLYILIICAIAAVLIQLIPLPADLWTRLPGRRPIAEAIESLRFPMTAAPLSETPYRSVLTLFAMIPAVATFAATQRLHVGQRAIAMAILAGMVGSILLGAVQVAGGPDSAAYFYRIHSPGAVGFFANQNHMATLLLLGIPMAAALTSSTGWGRGKHGPRYLIAGALFVLIIIGIVLTGSRAAISLAIPVSLASVTLVPHLRRWRTPALVLSSVGFVAAVIAVAAMPIAGTVNVQSSSSGSRLQIWSNTAKMIEDNFPAGTGLGSFEQVYHRYEPVDNIGPVYVNHAHNEYLEIVAELGLPGLILLLVFLIWWMAAGWKIWRFPGSSVFARAATIGSAVILIHSLVDFPIRTAAVSAIFGVCLGLMVRHPGSTRGGDSVMRRPVRHVQLT
jgi:O-antigen ligase